MDFFKIKEGWDRSKGTVTIFPDFVVCRSKDLMVRGKSFYAIWDQEKGLWSTDEYDVQRLVDDELREYQNDFVNRTHMPIESTHVKYMSDFSSNSWVTFRNYVSHISDSNHTLDNNLTFQNTQLTKQDYVSKRLNYCLEEGPIEAYEELISTLYDPEEREKIEWAIGAVVSGDAKTIQKFLVFHGEAGTGKSTILNIIMALFDGYYTTFEAKALVSSNNTFATEAFRSNPLVAIQHDGDLSRIEDNTKLNSIVSHEEMVMNEKYKSNYTSKCNCFLFMGTNKPVKITDAKSGVIRRLIDVKPSGRKIPIRRYNSLVSQVNFELGAIAWHCLEVYNKLGKSYYNSYRPLDMIYQTDVFFNFVEANYFAFSEGEGISLTRAYEMYKKYCEESLVDIKLPKYKFREELKNYFKTFYDVTRVDDKQVRSYYSGFLTDKFESVTVVSKDGSSWLKMDKTKSLLDKEYSNRLAQYASANETPVKSWNNVTTVLSDLNTTRLHYVKPPENHIVIDFDLKDQNGNKSFEKNLEAASKWPVTYAELSKSGQGIHLHYLYEGDVSALSSVYADGIEVKTFLGGSSLRRMLSKCNDIPVATIKNGLPLKGAKKMISTEIAINEKSLRTLINRNLEKEYHPGTKPSIDFIYKLLEDMYNSGKPYDVTDLRPKILAFANNSTNHAKYCIEQVLKMKFKSEEMGTPSENYADNRIAFFDVEVFPNLFVVCWKFRGKDAKMCKMINPTPEEMEHLMALKLIGFNNRDYDNHICYARYLGYSLEELFTLSQRIIGGSKNSKIREAYNLSYSDIYDFSSKKQSLKKWEIELGIHHQELGLPWDKPVPDELWETVADYCCNDVEATEAVFEHLHEDWLARQILADISGLSLNDKTSSHAARIIFEGDKNPQNEFVYTDLSKEFPGYVFENGVSTYRGEEVGEGGYVYAEPGLHTNAVLLDVASMHPTSVEQLNLFGKYTKNFTAIKNLRVDIKHGNFEEARKAFGGKLAKYLDFKNEEDEKIIKKGLAAALKMVINPVYGLTSAKFDNPFRDPRNVDNIVAKRGALFMVDLKHEVQKRGFTVAHIKTDSIKIPNATPEIIQFVMDFGKKYGYSFEHEATYDRMCLVNDAVYIARYKDGEHAGEWTATGTQFAVPYVFKTLFSKEPITLEDKCETRSVTTAMYLDMNEKMPDVSKYELELEKREKLRKKPDAKIKLNPEFDSLIDADLTFKIREGHCYKFIGKVGLFCPVKKGIGGGVLLRKKDGKYYAVGGTKGYRWLEYETFKKLGLPEDAIDLDYYRELVDDAKATISKYVDFETFVSGDTETISYMPCSEGCNSMEDCSKCSRYSDCPDMPYMPF